MQLFEVREFQANKNTSTETMVANLHTNMERGVMERGLSVLKLKRAVVVGGGPSAADHIEDIRERFADGADVIALNGAARMLIDNGIIPQWHVIYDARPENVAFITDKPAWNYLIASHVSPAILDALAGRNVTLMHTHATGPLLEEIRTHYAGSHVIGGAVTVGLLMLNVLIVMGYRAARFYGYDSSNRDGKHHAYPQPLNDGNRTMTFHFRDKDYIADPAMAMQAREFISAFPVYEKMGLKIEVIGEGLLPDMWRAAKERGKALTGETLEDREADKYRQIWNNPAYRNWSPGEDNVETFIRACDVAQGSRVIDFGCGSGRATKRLSEIGYDVLGVDHAANCLDIGIRIPFCLANLWTLPALKMADWGFCCDVMEHIPPEKVDAVLAGIAANVRQGAFFQISHVPDNFGATIGHALHLTVENEDWWTEKLKRHFASVEVQRYVSTGRDGVFVCKHTISERAE